MARKTSTFVMKQKIAVGAVALVVVGVVIYFSSLVIKDSPVLGDFVEGEHYTVLENPRRVRSEKIEVMEFFSYGCIYCYKFDPVLNRWVEEHRDQIHFIRTPVLSSDYWRLLGRNYYTMEQLGLLDKYHLPFFREIHDVKRNLTTVDRLAGYFEDEGVPATEYRKAFDSPEVSARLRAADMMGRRLQVASVPTIVVQGKYMVRITRSVGTTRMLEIVDYLINREAGSADRIPGSE